MTSFPVAVDRLEAPICVADPEPKRHHVTGEIVTDRQGNPLWTVAVTIQRLGSRIATVVNVSTATEPHGITKGMHLRIIDLDATPWSLDGHSGVVFKAAQIIPCPNAGWRPVGPHDPPWIR
ncbi:hypothetical protein ABH935_005738 [Catenulispora sp. GAS73]|uniref:hypothetical protein n=1 Tax=Catenulispora sp. GAS73 TaxID=3156269 RepID=UPI003517C458